MEYAFQQEKTKGSEVQTAQAQTMKASANPLNLWAIRMNPCQTKP